MRQQHPGGAGQHGADAGRLDLAQQVQGAHPGLRGLLGPPVAGQVVGQLRRVQRDVAGEVRILELRRPAGVPRRARPVAQRGPALRLQALQLGLPVEGHPLGVRLPGPRSKYAWARISACSQPARSASPAHPPASRSASSDISRGEPSGRAARWAACAARTASRGGPRPGRGTPCCRTRAPPARRRPSPGRSPAPPRSANARRRSGPSRAPASPPRWPVPPRPSTAGPPCAAGSPPRPAARTRPAGGGRPAVEPVRPVAVVEHPDPAHGLLQGARVRRPRTAHGALCRRSLRGEPVRAQGGGGHRGTTAGHECATQHVALLVVVRVVRVVRVVPLVRLIRLGRPAGLTRGVRRVLRRGRGLVPGGPGPAPADRRAGREAQVGQRAAGEHVQEDPFVGVVGAPDLATSTRCTYRASQLTRSPICGRPAVPPRRTRPPASASRAGAGRRDSAAAAELAGTRAPMTTPWPGPL